MMAREQGWEELPPFDFGRARRVRLAADGVVVIREV